MADRVLEIDPLPDRHLGLVLERVPGQPPQDQHGGNRGEEPDNQRAGPQRPPASPSLLDLKKAEERKLAQALRGLALPSHQIDTAADRGERERRGHPQAEQPLEPRGRSAEVQRLLLRLAPMFLLTRPRCTEAGPEGNVGEGERQQQHPQGALQVLADADRGAVLVQRPARRGQRSPAVCLGDHRSGRVLLDGTVEARVLVPVHPPDLLDAKRPLRRSVRHAVNPQLQHPPASLIGLVAIRGWTPRRARGGRVLHQTDRRQSPAQLDPPNLEHADLPAPQPWPPAPTKGSAAAPVGVAAF
jgi:hypothetical protein